MILRFPIFVGQSGLMLLHQLRFVRHYDRVGCQLEGAGRGLMVLFARASA